MKTILLSPNLRKRGIASAVNQVCALLAAHETRLLLPMEARALEVDAPVEYLPLAKAAEEAELIIVLGGDGTILRIAETAARTGTPMLGINMGHVGYMTELEPGEIDLIERLFTGAWTVDNRMMLHARVLRAGREVYAATALNEVMVAKKLPFHIIHMLLEVDGEPVSSYKGDGLILATPTGSTAYAHSAGGPIIEPTAENILVTPVCPFTICARSLVFAPHRRLTVRAQGTEGGAACISVDGRSGVELCPGDVVEIARADCDAQLVRVKNQNFYQVLRHKLSDGGEST